tara:strand:+ start:55 stop:1932 length:1878 start_codon:yes stop_codon:yes gene_type:complete
VIPENITKEHLLKAIEEIDKEGVPVGRQSWMYDLNYKDKLYPPKVIISFANKYANGEELDHTSFKGGLKTPGFELLKKAGFQIVKKSVENNIDYFDQLKLFLDQSKTSNLKTKHYQKRYGELKLKVSFGQGVSARIPWISFLLEPNTTSNGIYPVYLLYKKQNILILAYGISETEAPIITWDILQKKTISDYFKEKKLEKPERYGDSYLFKVYDDLENLNRDTINNDLGDILDQYRQSAILYKNNKVDLFNSKKQAASIDISSFYESCKKTGLVFNYSIIQRFLSSLVTKPFVLLSGLSGSGKTKLAEAFVKWICQDKSQYKLVPVGADWTNREPLLGFPNALSKGEYTHPDNGVLKLIIEANKNADRPYFLILDEMNLSHVERYFADFLSTMESSDAEIQLHDDNTIEAVPKTIKLPKNLYIMGTVNIDETTYMFSPKVLDRANTIEFRVTENEITDFFKAPRDIDLKLLETKGANMATSFLELSQKSSEKADAELVKDELVAFFKELQKLGAEFGYRTANEAVKLTARLGDFGVDDKNTKIDIAIMQKLLPKLSGSRSRLVSVLTSLGKLCVTDDKIVTDFFGSKEYPDFTKTEGIKYPISFEKITRMHRNAMANGFASYAEA